MSEPVFGTCCNSGKVRIPLLSEPPQALQNLFVCDDPHTLDFHQNIVQYNSAMAFMSLGVEQDHSVNHYSCSSQG